MFVWDVASGDTIKKFQGHSGKVNAVTFNADASILASGASVLHVALVRSLMLVMSTGSFDSTVRLWDMKCVSISTVAQVAKLIEFALQVATTHATTDARGGTGQHHIDCHSRASDRHWLRGRLREDLRSSQGRVAQRLLRQ